MLRAAQTLIEHVLWHPLRNQPILKDEETLRDYLRATMGARRTECMRAMFLDVRNGLIRDEIMWTGTVDVSPVYVREVAKRALDLGAVGLVLMHNHPSGSAAPSRQDIAVTRELVHALKPLGVHLHDHLVVTRGEVASFRALGML